MVVFDSEYYDCQDCQCHGNVMTVSIDNYADEFELIITMHKQNYYSGRLVRAWRALRGKDQLIAGVVLDHKSAVDLANQLQSAVSMPKDDLTGEGLAYIHKYPDIEPI